MLSNFKIGTRLAVAFGLLVFLICAMAGIGSFQTRQINGFVSNISQNLTPSVNILDELGTQTEALRRMTLRHVLEIEADPKNALAIERAELIEKKIPATLATYQSYIISPQEAALNEQIKQLWASYLEQDNRLIALSNAGTVNFDETRQLASGASSRAFTALSKVIAEDIALNVGYVNEAGEAAAAKYIWQIRIFSAVTILVICAAIALGIVCTRSITRPLVQAVELARKVAAGDLSSRISVQGRDEVAQMLRALSDMNLNLSQLIGHVRSSSDSIATGSTQISAGSVDLSQRTEEQASNLEQTAASMEQISGTVRTNAETAREARSLADEASVAASKGGEVVGQVVSTMHDIAQSSNRVADIIGVIDGIAFQTNILALNAAVEAARAGDQGRGFAVVASEVRNLAGRSAEAAKEIKSLIGASVDRIEAGTRQVSQAGASMNEIVTKVRQVTCLMAEISTATDEQSTGIAQVGHAVSQLDSVTQQNAALVEESTAAAESLKNQAARLAELVGAFTLRAA